MNDACQMNCCLYDCQDIIDAESSMQFLPILADKDHSLIGLLYISKSLRSEAETFFSPWKEVQK